MNRDEKQSKNVTRSASSMKATVPGTTCNYACPVKNCTGRCGVKPRGHSGPHTCSACGHSWS